MHKISGSTYTDNGIIVLGKLGSTFYIVLTEKQETDPLALAYLGRGFRSFTQIEGFLHVSGRYWCNTTTPKRLLKPPKLGVAVMTGDTLQDRY